MFWVAMFILAVIGLGGFSFGVERMRKDGGDKGSGLVAIIVGGVILLCVFVASLDELSNL